MGGVSRSIEAAGVVSVAGGMVVNSVGEYQVAERCFDVGSGNGRA